MEATPRVGATGTGLPSHVADPGQRRPPSGDCDTCRPCPRAAACRRAAELTGELAAAGTPVPAARECTSCNESGWLPGQARDVTSDAESRRVPRSCRADRAPLTVTA